jgi:trehalose synthase
MTIRLTHSSLRTSSRSGKWLACGVALALLGTACVHAQPTPTPVCAAPAEKSSVDDYTRWLQDHSMLQQADLNNHRDSGVGRMWQHPYANPQPRAASALASVWFTAYPAAMLTPDGQSVLQTLGSADLWKAFGEIGIRGMHTGPMKRAGGITGRTYTPTVDGNFDRISSDIDPAFGTLAQYQAMTQTAQANRGIIIGDIIPGHSGKGADFRLAERGFGDYPGLYTMVRIEPADWSLLPPVADGKDSVNLKPDVVDQLKAKGYIVGQLPRTIFYEPGIKDTDWSATAVVKGSDGVERRWVYLHYFKAGQPTFNWLDPTFAAQRLVLGDAIQSLETLGESMLRLDANGFLGIEVGPKGGRAWSEGHPLSLTSNQLIAGMVRKLGGFTFQELNLTVEDIKSMSQGGADLSYDFITRPAYEHALVMGDTEFLRLMLGLEKHYQIDPAGLIHALQNHDELTLELVHFWFVHKDDSFHFRGKEMKGTQLREVIRAEMHGHLMGAAAPYNLKASNGISCTSATIAAAALGITDITHLTDLQKQKIQKAHLLMAAYNALQPGVFALSGWDLVGALTLPAESVKPLLADGDTRWINRGAYDLLGTNAKATQSASGLPRAQVLYGALPEQLKHDDSFASQLKKILAVRQQYRIYESELVDVPKPKAKGLLVMVHRLPENGGVEVTALNFGQTPVSEVVEVKAAKVGSTVSDLLTGKVETAVNKAGQLKIQLGANESKALLLK